VVCGTSHKQCVYSSCDLLRVGFKAVMASAGYLVLGYTGLYEF
jgi:hypothetical protein